ncbi:hypothetical protein DACRYDRAFT_94755 [Dacryopinax primogenitus]|uniref:Ubiquitin-like domain-containing protein n=1 Tax=Dacryopinax primogenitus (strain DJM 731) TaxID=1858805 RepID=M5FWW2_DACPD|nr:uncharacterized protein DACRYDRAFT_94755 [Dacryopinax primogenitus]EJU02471.1 hypothetical protein DACRYDRAFT_94755 [Dacryopinax primogenitus]
MSRSQDEKSFISQHLAALSHLRTAYPPDYVPPLEDLPRRPPIIPIDALPPPEKHSSNSESETITITIKSFKPALSFSVSLSPLDPISQLKHQLALHPRAPPTDAQRLLLKGKALVDARLVKEYDITEGSTVMLMVKPGYEWTQAKPDDNPMEIDTPPPPPGRSSTLSPGNQPIPTLTLSTEIPSRPPTPSGPTPPPQLHTVPINTDILTASIPSTSPDAGTPAKYHQTISSKSFWTRLYGFLRLQFEEEEDAAAALDQFLLASKGSLTAGEIARVREAVGVVGMGGKGL